MTKPTLLFPFCQSGSHNIFMWQWFRWKTQLYFAVCCWKKMWKCRGDVNGGSEKGQVVRITGTFPCRVTASALQTMTETHNCCTPEILDVLHPVSRVRVIPGRNKMYRCHNSNSVSLSMTHFTDYPRRDVWQQQQQNEVEWIGKTGSSIGRA